MNTLQKFSSLSIAILALLAAAAVPCRAQSRTDESLRQEPNYFSSPRAKSAGASGTEQASAPRPSFTLPLRAGRVNINKTEDARPRLSLKAFRGWEQLTAEEKRLSFQRQLEASQFSRNVVGEHFSAGGHDRGAKGDWKSFAFVPSRGPLPLGQWANYGGDPDWNREHLTQLSAPAQR